VGGGLGEGGVREGGGAGARDNAEPAGAVAEGAVEAGNPGTGAAGAEGAGAVGSGDEGGSGGELRGPGVVSAGTVGGGGRGRKRRREAVGEGRRCVDAGDKPADTVQAEGYLQHTTRRSRSRERHRAHIMTKCVASLLFYTILLG
jgi:hypothetical protein